MALTWTSIAPPVGDLDHVNHWKASCGPLRVTVYTEENNENIWYMDLDCDSITSTTDAVIQKKVRLDFKSNPIPDHTAAKANAQSRLYALLTTWRNLAAA